MDAIDAINIARQHLEARGFTFEAASSESEAVYLTHPGREGTLRLACHGCRHPFGVVHSVEFKCDRYGRDAVFAYYVGNLDAEAVKAIADEAGADYLARAEESESDEN